MCRRERRWRSTGYGRHFFTQRRRVCLSEGKWVIKWRQTVVWVRGGGVLMWRCKEGGAGKQVRVSLRGRL